MKQLLQLRVNARGLLEVFAALAALGTVTALCGEAGWLFELATHFRLQYALALILAAALWPLLPRPQAAVARGIGRRYGFPVGCLVAAAIDLAVLWPYIGVRVPAEPEPARASGKVRIVALNVHTGNARHDLVESFLRASEADVILLTEVDERWLTQLAGLTNRWPHRLVEPRDDNFGIALFSRWPLAHERVMTLGLAELPSLEAQVCLPDRRLWLLGTHPVPPANATHAAWRDDQLAAVGQRAGELSGPRVLLGDLNATPWSPAFRRLEARSGLGDSLRGRGYQASWPVGVPLFGIPLDHALVSPDIRVLSRRLGPSVGSDHRPLVLELVWPEQPDSTTPGPEPTG